MKNFIIIIPIRQSLVKKDCLIRLYYNCLSLKNMQVTNVLVADATTNFFLRRLVQNIVEYFDYQYVEYPQASYYTPATIKNYAAKHAFSELKAEHIMFLDVDVFLTNKSLEYLKEKSSLDIGFDWLPVVFLRKGISCKNIINKDYTLCEPNIIQIGYTTGIHLFSKSFFNLLVGYDESFVGYGCEDIDMLHRATRVLGVRKQVMDEYYQDIRSYDVNKLGGFRKFFFSYKSSHRENAMPLHVWHKRQNKSLYLRARVNNDLVLLEKMKEFDRQL